MPDDAKAEGLAVAADEQTHWDVLIVFDGVESGGPTLFGATKSAGQ